MRSGTKIDVTIRALKNAESRVRYWDSQRLAGRASQSLRDMRETGIDLIQELLEFVEILSLAIELVSYEEDSQSQDRGNLPEKEFYP